VSDSIIQGQVFPDWISVKDDVHQAIFAQIHDFDKNLGTNISTGSLRGLKAYTGKGMSSIQATGYMNDLDVNGQLNSSMGQSKMQFNITAALIDTLVAKLGSIQTVPQAVTFKGNVKGRKLAEDLNFLLKGLFHKYDLSHLTNLAFRDAMINRAGYLKVIKEDGEIRIDRVLVNEIIIDPADGYYNNPYKMIHRKTIPIAVLIENYPDYANQIRDCKIQEIRQANTQNYTPSIEIAEAWCKNSYMSKGRHVICIETATFLDEEWDKDYFPILKCEYNEPVIGWLGQSVVEELYPIQLEIDRILASMQAIMRIISIPRVFVDTNSQVNKEHLTNKVGLILLYDSKQGVAPIIHNGAGMPPELPAQLQVLISQAYARVGLTPMDSQGMQKTGSGNQSGEALKTMTDIKSERWQVLQHNYEHKHVELAELILKELQGTNMRISALDKHIGLKEIRTKVIPKIADSYVIKMYPVSSLPDSIPDLIDSVERMKGLGVIQPSMIPELFNMPDLDAFTTLQSAPRKLVEKKIEDMLDGGKYWNPEPYHDLDYALGHALQHYNWGQLNNESDKSLAKIRRFINDVKILIAQRTPTAPIAQGAAPGQSAPQPITPPTGPQGGQPQ
jgi:hypothetical protein